MQQVVYTIVSMGSGFPFALLGVFLFLPERTPLMHNYWVSMGCCVDVFGWRIFGLVGYVDPITGGILCGLPAFLITLFGIKFARS